MSNTSITIFREEHRETEKDGTLRIPNNVHVHQNRAKGFENWKWTVQQADPPKMFGDVKNSNNLGGVHYQHYTRYSEVKPSYEAQQIRVR